MKQESYLEIMQEDFHRHVNQWSNELRKKLEKLWQAESRKWKFFIKEQGDPANYQNWLFPQKEITFRQAACLLYGLEPKLENYNRDFICELSNDLSLAGYRQEFRSIDEKISIHDLIVWAAKKKSLPEPMIRYGEHHKLINGYIPKSINPDFKREIVRQFDFPGDTPMPAALTLSEVCKKLDKNEDWVITACIDGKFHAYFKPIEFQSGATVISAKPSFNLIYAGLEKIAAGKRDEQGEDTLQYLLKGGRFKKISIAGEERFYIFGNKELGREDLFFVDDELNNFSHNRLVNSFPDNLSDSVNSKNAPRTAMQYVLWRALQGEIKKLGRSPKFDEVWEAIKNDYKNRKEYDPAEVIIKICGNKIWWITQKGKEKSITYRGLQNKFTKLRQS